MVVQDPMVGSGQQDCIMEEAIAQIVVSETQQVGVYVSQSSVGTPYIEIPVGLLKTIE